jgi:hypothetical protein
MYQPNTQIKEVLSHKEVSLRQDCPPVSSLPAISEVITVKEEKFFCLWRYYNSCIKKMVLWITLV